MSESDLEQPGPSGPAVTAAIKWYSHLKGFGFVQPADGSPDAFLHVSVVAQSGIRDLPIGATIVCEITEGPRGPQVSAIHSVEDIPQEEFHGDSGGEARVVEGTVKFFSFSKGFGFVIPDDGGKDVYVSIRALESSGVTHLEPEQRVRLKTRIGQKGPMADQIEVL